MFLLYVKPVAHSEKKLKQNSETTYNSFKLVLALLAYFSVCE